MYAPLTCITYIKLWDEWRRQRRWFSCGNNEVYILTYMRNEDFAYENMIGIVIDAQHTYTLIYLNLTSQLLYDIISF